jgi:hypothetical protein
LGSNPPWAKTWDSGVHHHLLVIPAERDELAGSRQPDEALDHAGRVDAAVDVVPERDHHVVGRRGEGR